MLLAHKPLQNMNENTLNQPLIYHKRRQLNSLYSILLSALIQHPLGTHHLSLPPGNPARRHPNRHGQRLKRTLSPVVVIVASYTINMQRDTSALREALQTMRQHLGAQIADFLALQTKVYHGVGPVGEIDDGA